MRSMLKAFAVAAAALMASAAPSLAVPITGGTTQVTLTAAPTLASLGVAVAPFGTATITGPANAPVATFPITGGDTTAGVSTIQHNGSGLNLTRSGTTVSIRNFLINTQTATISGDAFVNSTSAGNLALFTFDPGLNLSLTGGAASALNGAFGVTAFSSGLAIGTAVTSPQTGSAAVPEPASLALLLGGLLGLSTLRRRRA